MTDLATRTRFSRRIRIDQHYYELQAGDQVDMSLDLDPTWCTIAQTGSHDENGDNAEACDGSCDAVLLFEDDDHPPLHVTDSEEIYARFRAEEAE
jgi:hypothetical protein